MENGSFLIDPTVLRTKLGVHLTPESTSAVDFKAADFKAVDFKAVVILATVILATVILAANIPVATQALGCLEDTQAVSSRARLLQVAAYQVNRTNRILRTRTDCTPCRRGTVVISLISRKLQG